MSLGRSSQKRHRNALTEKPWEDVEQARYTTRNKFSFCVTRPVTNGNAVDHIDRIQLPKVSSGSVKNMAFVGLFNPAGSQTLFQ